MTKLTPQALLGYLGIQFSEKTNRLSLCCPFHPDRNPSAGFYIDSEKFFCYTCSLSLDLTGFLAKFQGVSRVRAEVEIVKAFGEQPENKGEDRKLEAGRTRTRLDPILKAVRSKGMKELALREEELESILWEYETGKTHKQAFNALVTQWVQRCEGDQGIKIADTLE